MIRLIAAADKKRGLAKNGIQPWKLPQDEQYFLAQTKKYGGVVLMGRKTFEVIGHPLKNRRNIILSRKPEEIDGAEVSADLQKALRAAEDIWVIGGESVFRQTIEISDEIYLTRIDADFSCDQFFPEIPENFSLLEKSDTKQQNGLNFTYCVYGRIK